MWWIGGGDGQLSVTYSVSATLKWKDVIVSDGKMIII